LDVGCKGWHGRKFDIDQGALLARQRRKFR